MQKWWRAHNMERLRAANASFCKSFTQRRRVWDQQNVFPSSIVRICPRVPRLAMANKLKRESLSVNLPILDIGDLFAVTLPNLELARLLKECCQCDPQNSERQSRKKSHRSPKRDYLTFLGPVLKALTRLDWDNLIVSTQHKPNFIARAEVATFATGHSRFRSQTIRVGLMFSWSCSTLYPSQDLHPADTQAITWGRFGRTHISG